MSVSKCEKPHASGLLCDKAAHGEDQDHEGTVSLDGKTTRYTWNVGDGHLYLFGCNEKPALHAAFTKREWSKHNEATWSAELGYGLDEIVEWTWGQFAEKQVMTTDKSPHLCPFCEGKDMCVAMLEALLLHVRRVNVCTTNAHRARLHFAFIQGWIAQQRHAALQDAIDYRLAYTEVVFDTHECACFGAGHQARIEWLWRQEGGQ